MNLIDDFHLKTKTPTNINLRKDIEFLIRESILSADPHMAIQRILFMKNNILQIAGKEYDLRNYRKIYLLALGKAAVPMIRAAYDSLSDKNVEGLAITKKLPELPTDNPKVRIIKGDHPLPGLNSLKAAEAALMFLSSANKRDLVIFLISGGGSALICKPTQNISLEEIRKLSLCLLDENIPIQEMNVLRKRLDMVKGGGLLAAVNGADVVSLVLSDVIGDDLGSVSSGPSVPDDSTFEDCLEIVTHRRLKDKIPAKILDLLENGANGKLLDEQQKPMVSNIYHHEMIIGSIDLSMQRMEHTAKSLGYNVQISNEYLRGPIEVEQKRITNESKIFFAKFPIKSIMIWGGECTVQRVGAQKGGRNQHIGLLLLDDITRMEHITGVAIATDGEDGSTDAAGVVFDGYSIRRGQEAGMDIGKIIQEQESYTYFQRLNDLIITGSTGTNVNDIIFLIKD